MPASQTSVALEPCTEYRLAVVGLLDDQLAPLNRIVSPPEPTAQTSLAPLPQTQFRSAVEGLCPAVQPAPSECSRVWVSPTAQRSLADDAHAAAMKLREPGVVVAQPAPS